MEGAGPQRGAWDAEDDEEEEEKDVEEGKDEEIAVIAAMGREWVVV